jgi:hypothetical protein
MTEINPGQFVAECLLGKKLIKTVVALFGKKPL